nr:MAG TPA: hypothetical protein [Caudoviricetes sp.]
MFLFLCFMLGQILNVRSIILLFGRNPLTARLYFIY